MVSASNCREPFFIDVPCAKSSRPHSQNKTSVRYRRSPVHFSTHACYHFFDGGIAGKGKPDSCESVDRFAIAIFPQWCVAADRPDGCARQVG